MGRNGRNGCARNGRNGCALTGTAAPWPECPERLGLGRRGRNGMMLDALRRNRRERWL